MGRNVRRRELGAALAGALILAVAGCGADDEQDVDLTGPLTALPPCEEPAPAIDATPAPGIVLPDDAILLEQRDQAPMTNAAGYVAMTPIQVRLDYEQRDDIELLQSEDEIFEAELLLSTGDHRTFVRATAACDEGSNLLIVTAPETDRESVPAPQGDGTATQ